MYDATHSQKQRRVRERRRQKRLRGEYPDTRKTDREYPRCGVTHKKRFPSKGAAGKGLKEAIMLRGEDAEHRECRSYRCYYCGGWHLTSQPWDEFRRQVEDMVASNAPTMSKWNTTQAERHTDGDD